MAGIPADIQAWMDNHLRTYLESNGAEGHLMEFSAAGGLKDTPTLVLKTIGRQSGKPRLAPLIYGKAGDEFVVIASKGGAPDHPAWYVNLIAQPDVSFQVVGKKYRASWRLAEGDERAKVWDAMVKVYPPYTPYQASTKRRIPVILLKPIRDLAAL